VEGEIRLVLSAGRAPTLEEDEPANRARVVQYSLVLDTISR